ncbi:tetratricopeptide repeat protein [Winogradskyella sp. SM1960]|uniref:tetratricopeptide repeat protein n=1 Tax=Winogradskyella sp. SM1960 TaxID=2865955 RepID=UPI001CD3EABE|nr:tetratricopeptide repeat protein [Winogradskyella sp. SM1960]
MKIRYIVVFCLMPFFCFGQNPKQIDSLIYLIKKSKDLSDEGQHDSSYYYAKISYNLAKRLKADSLQVDIVGILSTYEPDLEKALSYIDESEPLAIKNKQWKALEYMYHNRGALYYHRTKDERALVHFLKLDSLLEVRQDHKFLAAMTKVSIINVLYDSRTENDTSFFPQMSKNITDGLNIVKDGLALSKDSINFYNAHALNVPAAILYEKKAYIYTQRNQPEKAIANYQMALENTMSNDNHLRKSLIYNGLANLYDRENQKDSALHYFKKELIAITKTTDTLRQAISNYKVAEFYNNNGDPKTALQHLNTSQKLMENAFFVREDNKYAIQDILASVYFNLGNFEEAFKASEKARQHLTIIQTEFNKKNVSELETAYQTNKKEQEISLLKSENEIIEQRSKNQKIILLSVVGITTIAGLFLYLLYRNRKKTNTKLRELDALKTNFFTNISHEFRTPLTLIASPIDDTLADASISDKKRQQFTVAK